MKRESRFHLRKLTIDPTDREEAHRLVQFEVAHVPEEDRASTLESVPLHRDIMLAAQELALASEGGRTWVEHRGEE